MSKLKDNLFLFLSENEYFLDKKTVSKLIENKINFQVHFLNAIVYLTCSKYFLLDDDIILYSDSDDFIYFITDNKFVECFHKYIINNNQNLESK